MIPKLYKEDVSVNKYTILNTSLNDNKVTLIERLKSRVSIKFSNLSLLCMTCKRARPRVKLFNSACERLFEDTDIL